MKMKYSRFEFDMPVNDILFVAISGSHAYGTARPDSDIDLRAVKMPDVHDVMKIQANVNKVHRFYANKGTPEEVDVEVVPIVRWLRTLLGGNGNYLENLYQEKMFPHKTIPSFALTAPEMREFTRYNKYRQETLDELTALVEDYGLSKNFAGHYLGFAKSQRKDFYQKWKIKCLLYTYRVLMSGIVLFRDNIQEHNLYKLMEYVPSDYLPALMEKYVTEKSLMNDKVKWEMEKEFERLTELLIKYRDESKLPEEPDYDVFDEWLYTYYVSDLCSP